MTNLPNRDQIIHVVEVIGGKLAIASRFDFLPGFVNFCSQSFLNVTILGQLPESKSQLELGQAPLNTKSIRELTALAVVSWPANMMVLICATISSSFNRQSGRRAELDLTK